MSRRAGSWLLAAVLGIAAAGLLLQAPREPAPIEVGRAAPGFELPPLDGGAAVSLESLRGRVVLVNFWASWCKPCEDEMPAMQSLYGALAGEPFELLAISEDDGREEIVSFRDRLALTFPILHDVDKRAAGDYQSFRFPESFLVDRDGTLVARYIGPRDWQAPEYEARIRRLLASD